MMRISGQANHNRPRSGSSFNYPAIRMRKHRVGKSQDLNRLRKNIQQMFEAEEKSYYQVKELTSKVSPAHSCRINQICLKYSICSNPRKRKTQAEDIDVESIARSYINSKSKEKRQELIKKELKKAIALTSRRYQDSSSPECLKEINAKVKKIDKSRTQEDHINDRHYLTIYQKSQAEVISKVVKQHKMELQQINQSPNMVEIDEWEKDQKKMKEVYKTIKNLRAKTTKYRQRVNDKEEATGTFYIT